MLLFGLASLPLTDSSQLSKRPTEIHSKAAPSSGTLYQSTQACIHYVQDGQDLSGQLCRALCLYGLGRALSTAEGARCTSEYMTYLADSRSCVDRKAGNRANPVQTMFAGVLRDDARQKAKKAEREARAQALEEEARKRAFLERTQPVSNASDGSRQALEGGKELQPMDVVEFQGCTTCR